MSIFSPVPKKKSTSKMIEFSEAVSEIILGHKLTKLEWQNPAEYILLKDGFLCIHHSADKEDQFHRLLVSEGDLIGKDWMVIIEEEYAKN